MGKKKVTEITDIKDKLVEWYEDKGKNLDKYYNPWKEGKKDDKDEQIDRIGYKKIKEFVENENDSFGGWIDFEGVKPATKYTIPAVCQGKYKEALLYQCLYNPGASEKAWASQAQSLTSFKEEMKGTAEERYITKPLEELDEKEEAAEFKTDKEKAEFVRDKIIKNNNILHEELERIKEEFDELKEKNKLKKYKLKEYNKSDEDIKKEIDKFTKKEIKDCINKECYYIKTYYKALLANSQEPFIDVAVENLKEKNDNGEFETYLKQIENARICNLELVPFSTKNKSDIDIDIDKNKNILKENQVYIDFVVAIILARIGKYYKEKEENEVKPPVFVFRSRLIWFDEMRKFIDSEILDEENNEKVADILETNLNEFFYEFVVKRNGIISPNNIKKIGGSTINPDEFKDKFLSVLE